MSEEDYPARHLKPSRRRKNRTKDLPKLNVRAAWRIGEPRPDIKPDPLVETVDRWEQRKKPASGDRAFEDALGMYLLEGRIYVGRKKGERVGTVL